jgi:flagellar biosynthesis/type III secretory pathway protein FliH
MTHIEAPKRIWVSKTDLGEVFWMEEEYDIGTEYVRADNVISRAEADAMVAAAIFGVRETIVKAWFGTNEGRELVETVVAAHVSADARAALDAMVRKAVEAERERCAKIADGIEEKWRFKYSQYSASGFAEGMSAGASEVSAAIREEPTS